MKKTTHIFLLLLISISCKTKIDKEALKNELDNIYELDQKYREILNSNDESEQTVSFLKAQGYTLEQFKKNGWDVINKQDSINLNKVEKIIQEYGYPGKSLVGEPTNKAVWYVIQHSEKIKEYLPLIEKAGRENEIPMTLVAMMKDRQLMYENKEQIYGTQGAARMITNKKTGKEEYKWFIWPIKNHKDVNQLRKSIGYNRTIEEYAKSLNITYEHYTIEQVENLNFD